MMIQTPPLLPLGLLALLCFCSGVAAETLTKRWTLYHSLHNQNWVRRGAVSLDILESDDNEEEDANLKPEDRIQLKIENDDTESDLVDAWNKASWYQLKLVEGGDADAEASGGNAVMTTVSACQVRRANFRDELVLTFGRLGHVTSLSYVPLVSPLAPSSCDDLEGDVKAFQSRVRYETAVPGMTLRTVLPSYQPPPGLKFISTKGNRVSQQATQDAPDGKGGGKPGVLGNDDGNGGGNQQNEPPEDNTPFGFLKRYWYIIVPIMLMNFMSAPAEDEQQQQQGGSQPQNAGGQAAPQPQVAAAGTASPGAQPARAGKRRGKRGT